MPKFSRQFNLLLFLSVLMMYSFSFGQIANIVETEGIKTELQKKNIGKIFFTDKKIGNDVLKQEDFLNSYTFTNKSNLFFVAYFDNSLTNYKHFLSPETPVDSLFKSGNYQFTLFVDGKETYKSNLMPGAPQSEVQDQATSLNRPFIDNMNGQGSWSESFWNRFLNNGGDQALSDGSHTLKMEIRPYVKTETVKAGEVIASGSLKLNVVRNPKIDISNIVLNKILPYNGFSISKEKYDTEKIKFLKGSIDEGIFKKINSIVVIKNSGILIEEYFNGENRATLHDPRSVGKSFTSTLMGQAIADGYIKDESEPLKAFYQLDQFKNFSTTKEQITIKDLLTMSSGFDGNDEDSYSPGNEENMYPASDWVKFALDLPFQEKLNHRWHYFTAGVVVLGDIINKSVPNGLKKYADEKLFKPLGIKHYEWQYTPQGVPNTAGGIRMNALDFAKYGQLYKNKGIWNKKQILAKNWINSTFTKQNQITGRKDEYYGYLFWNKRYKSNRKLYEAYYCAGNGGNYILIFKDQPLVIVITASAYGQPYAHSQVDKMVQEFILPAVMGNK
ncbi:serine hydrolase domain-containing protein [uncultured Chryseobacterium sp.]|uniref:serine hydrolase domain-containing protein n=1 Tax=uncultured Chryseobacterium sp. TaxID=259322 RepID=UPI0037480B86